MNRLEALADAIASLNDCLNPDSEAYKLRNPGMLKVYSIYQLRPQNESGYRVFETFWGGYKALIYDLERKCTDTRANVKDQTLASLLKCYGWRDEQAVSFIIAFLRKALDDRGIGPKTQVSFFVEEKLCQISSQETTVQ